MKYLLLSLSFIFCFTIDAQQTIYAEAGSESGRGFLKNRGDECFAIIPNHLLRDHFGTLDLYGEGSLKSEADMIKTYNADLAILRFIGDNNIPCSTWKVDRDFQKVISVVTKCKLEIREKTGEISTIATSVSAIDDEIIFVKPDNFREKIVKGMSGSSLFCEYQGRKVYLGMLQRVDDNTGEVLMADEIEETLSEFFNPRKSIRRGDSEKKISMGIVKEVGGFKFELSDIERSGSNVTLKFNVTSLEKDNHLHLHYKYLNLFDDEGVLSNPFSLVLGSQSGSIINYSMIHGVNVPLEIKFNNVASSAKLISKLSVNFTENNNNNIFELRGIELPGGTVYGSQYNGNQIEGVKTISGFKFELISVSKSGENATVQFMVSSEDRDNQLGLHYKSIQLYDDKGFTTHAKSITCGNQTNSIITYNMIHGIATPLKIEFSGINSSAENIALLKMAFTAGGVSSEYQQRNVPLNSPESYTDSDSYTSKGSNTTNVGCSELYFYRMKGIAQCEENISLLNHDDEILRLETGTRYKAIVCDDREFDFKATIGKDELIPGLKRPNIELGKKYYFKVGCTLGATVIIQQDENKGEMELNKRGKYKMKVKDFKLNDW